MSTTLEVDDSSKSLIASWFGVDRDNYRLQSSSTENRAGNEFDVETENSFDVSETNSNLKSLSLVLTRKKTVSGFVGEKLQKKLKKLKHRKDNIDSDTQQQIGKKAGVEKVKKGRKKEKSLQNYEEEYDSASDDCSSKAKVIEKSKKKTPIVVRYTVESLNKALNDNVGLSNSKRKRLKKKLHKLLQEKEAGRIQNKSSDEKNSKMKENKIDVKEQKQTSKSESIEEDKEKENNIGLKSKNHVKKSSECFKKKSQEHKSHKRKINEDATGTSNSHDDGSPRKKQSKSLCSQSQEIKNGNEKKKKKRRNITNLDESSQSNVSITDDIAVIDRLKQDQDTFVGKKGKNSVSQAMNGKKKKKQKTETIFDSNIKDHSEIKDVFNVESISTLQFDSSDKFKQKTKSKNHKPGKSLIADVDKLTGNSENFEFSIKKKKKVKKTKINNAGSVISANTASTGSSDCDTDSQVEMLHFEGKNSTSEKRKIDNIDGAKEKGPSVRDDSPPRKRKKHKTRSKQKNIRKDHRPEHLKPAYLQQKLLVKKDEDDND